jgi:hypothetical protein
MTIVALVVFAMSLLLILVLFAVKRIEADRPRRFADGVRTRADAGALRVKAILETGESYLEELPFFLGAFARYLVHIGALSFARLARASAYQAHLLADFVSHKRGFERRETKSQFLKDVSEYPIRKSREASSNGAGKNRSDDDNGVATM